MIGDQGNELSDGQQGVNIFLRVKDRGVTIADFMDMSLSVVGNVKEMKPRNTAAYFFVMLNDRYKLREVNT